MRSFEVNTMGGKQHVEGEIAMRTRNARWSRTTFFVAAVAVATLGTHPVAVADDQQPGQRWVATWATAPATFFQYVPPVAPAPPGPPTTFAPANIQPDLGYPFPDANTAGATDQTFRTIVKPDLWGDKMRFRFSNVFGSQAVTFSAVTVALQEFSGNLVEGTVTLVTFSGKKSVMIRAGQEIFSDGISLSWVQGADDPGVLGRNLAVSYAVEGDSGPMTFTVVHL